MKNKIFTIPNILSFFRLALIPFIVWMLLIGQNIVAMILVVLSALTDVVDGYVARRFLQYGLLSSSHISVPPPSGVKYSSNTSSVSLPR